MGLSKGTCLGPYEIRSVLGAGGMGEVYRAHDRNLNRDVAIKVLPQAVAADPERIARFEREAQLLAALNHPNIAHIYGLEESAGIRALVMELVDGPTLADRLGHGAIPIDEALAIARQIADAVDAAHEQGIIHRDLKPANIKVREDGTVKVLDFGLAKLSQPRIGGAATDGSASTITSPAMVTGAGVLLGTASYMSPEQAKGRPADKRSDIWAFGCVVHEMLTGRRVFGGGEVEDAIANVLTTEPSWDALPAKTPVSVRRMLRRCLERDPRQRLRAIGDAQLELLDATTSSKTEHDVPASARAQGRRERLAWAVAFGLLSAVVALGAAHQFRSPPTARELHVDVNTPPTNDVASFAISPDGRAIAFVALDRGQQQLWVRSLESSALRLLAGTEGARLPFWSPDGKSLGFFVDTRLKRLDLDSGAIQTLAPVVTPGGGTWNRDGMILYVPNNGIGPIMQVAASGGEPAAIAQLNPTNIGNRQPSFLPDGRHFLFFVAGGPNPRGVYLGELGRNNPKRLLTADAPALYAAGHLLFVRDTILFAQPFDLDKGEPGGRVIHVADAVDVNSSGIVALSTSADGSIAYRSGRSEGVRALIWFDRAGNQIGGPVGSSLPAARVGIALSNPALSPDGSRLAVQHGGDIWILDVNRDVANRFTSDPGIEALPVWSPDGLRIVFDSPRQGPADLYVKRTDDSSPEQLLLATPEAKFPADWSPDGHLLLYKTVNAKTGTYDMWALPVVGAAKPFPIVRTDFDERDGQFSPDGKWLAYESNESGRPDIYVQPFPGPGVKTRISAAGGTQTRWRSDGRELFYVAPDNRLMAVRFDGSGGHVTVASPVPLFATHILASSGILRQQYVVSRDGQRFLMNTMTGEATASSISLILHWADKS